MLLALPLDRWREDAAQRARFAEAVHSLADEATLNRELLALPVQLAHHRRLLAHYQSRADSATPASLRLAHAVARRVLVENTLEVHPIKDVGAVEMGTHRVYVTAPGHKEKSSSQARFVHL